MGDTKDSLRENQVWRGKEMESEISVQFLYGFDFLGERCTWNLQVEISPWIWTILCVCSIL